MFNHLAYEKCGCVEPLSIDSNELQYICNSLKDLNCSSAFYAEFYADEKYSTSNYKKYCPIECIKVDYEADLHSEKLTDSFFNAVKNDFYPNSTSITLVSLKENVIILNVFYRKIEYTLIEESISITLLQLISNCGGVGGLFIGYSLISTFEILDIIGLFLQKYFLIKKKTQNSVTDSKFGV